MTVHRNQIGLKTMAVVGVFEWFESLRRYDFRVFIQELQFCCRTFRYHFPKHVSDGGIDSKATEFDPIAALCAGRSNRNREMVFLPLTPSACVEQKRIWGECRKR